MQHARQHVRLSPLLLYPLARSLPLPLPLPVGRGIQSSGDSSGHGGGRPRGRAGSFYGDPRVIDPTPPAQAGRDLKHDEEHNEHADDHRVGVFPLLALTKLVEASVALFREFRFMLYLTKLRRTIRGVLCG